MNSVKSLKTRAMSEKYLQQHRVKELLNFMMAQLIIHQPDDPLMFLVNLLDQCMLARKEIWEPPALFDSEHIQQIFKSFDLTNCGTISMGQFRTAMASLGIVNPQDPTMTVDGNITMEVFEAQAKNCLKNYIITIINS